MDLSTKSLLFLLLLIGSCAGQDALPEGPVDGVLGKRVTFRTLVEPDGAFMVIIWSFNGGSELIPVVTVTATTEKVADAYQGRVTVNRTNAFLTLGPLQAKDSGDYSVSLVNAAGVTKTGETKLRVLEPVSNLAIKSNVSEVVEFNSTVLLTCSAKGSFLKFSWTNNTKPIVDDGKRLILIDEDTSSMLTIANVLRSDLVGPIYCTATNKLEMEKSAPFNLSVSYGPESVSVKPPPPFVKKGSNITLSCAATSSPPATLSWYHNGAMLKVTGPQLILKDIKEQQSGNYSCMAHNTKTLRYVSSAMIHFTVQEAISGSKITGPTTPLIAGKHAANLSCQATARTVTTRTWTKDNKPLSPSARVTLSEDGSIVTIKPVQKEDNGEYKCQLANRINTDSASYTLVVNYGPESMTVTGEEAVEVNEPVMLKCSVASMPVATYTWKFNGTKMDVKTADYTIEKAVYKNTGTYTCEAHNAVTGLSITDSHKLSVKEEGALDEGLSDGAIAGIIIGVLAALAAAIAAVIYLRRKRTIESPY